MMRVAGAALAVAAALLPAPAPAWSAAGHRVVATVAETRLTPEARALVRDVLGDLTLADVADWADQQDRRVSGSFHWVNIPFDAPPVYDAARHCPEDRCIVAAIERFTRDLRDGRSALARADGLRWLVHLVGDLHQPLHAGDPRDRGGNELEVRFRDWKDAVSFHELWDRHVVDAVLRSTPPEEAGRKLAAALGSEEAAAWAAETSPAAWAVESNLEARALYDELGITPRKRNLTLPEDYRASQRPRVVRALGKAGVRLAALLNGVAAAQPRGASER